MISCTGINYPALGINLSGSMESITSTITGRIALSSILKSSPPIGIAMQFKTSLTSEFRSGSEPESMLESESKLGSGSESKTNSGSGSGSESSSEWGSRSLSESESESGSLLSS
ncbi:unnamed protein product [Prunus brigantina]